MGVWYQIQPDFADKTDTDVPSCESYNVTSTDEPNKYVIQTLFELYTKFEGDTPYQYESISNTNLTVLDENSPAKFFTTPTIGNLFLMFNKFICI